MRIGVALSGGGHRASLWSSGALLALVDAGVQADVVSIASVSGGSIANGVVAAEVEFTATSRRQLEEALRPALRTWAHHGVFFPGPATDAYVARVLFLAGLLLGTVVAGALTLAGVGRSWSLGVVVGVAIAHLVAAVIGGAFLASKLPSPVRVAAFLGTVTSTLLAAGGLAAAREADRWPTIAAVAVGAVVVVIVLAVVTAKLFARRSRKVDAALGAMLAHGADAPTITLAGLTRTVNHVFCATNLATADHLYMSPSVVYGNELGAGAPHHDLPLSTAVQASACLPAAFAPRALHGAELAPGLRDETVVLTDGGVYDNMGDQWELGFRNRAGRDPGAVVGQGEPADALVVVNASRAFTHQPIKATGPLAGIDALMRCKDVLYDVSTSVRRRYLVDTFTMGADGPNRLGGVLVHIGQTPRRVPEAFTPDPAKGAPPPGSVGARALEARAFLDRLQTLEPTEWEVRAEVDGAVPTTLGPIGAETSVDLLHHAYMLGRINSFVTLGFGLLPPGEATDDEVLDEWGRARFAALLLDP